MEPKPIQRGGQGKIYRARYKDKDGNEISVVSKVVRSDPSEEVEILKRLSQCPQIVHLYEVIRKNSEWILVEEYCKGGDLLDYLNAHDQLNEAQVKEMLRNLFEAVKFCHEHNICHCDLRLENICVSDEEHPENIKLIDFGFAHDTKNVIFPPEHVAHSCHYLAPEARKKDIFAEDDLRALDCWALGVIAYAIDRMEFPTGKIVCRDKLLTDLVRGLLCAEPTKRLTIAKALEHEYFRVI